MDGCLPWRVKLQAVMRLPEEPGEKPGELTKFREC